MDLEKSLSITTEHESKPSSTKRKGFAAKKRDAEKFRMKKNLTFDDKMVGKFSEARTITDAVTTIFKDLPYTPSQRPPVEILIQLIILPKLVKLVLTYLRDACKVNIDQSDIETFILVTIYQIEARVYRSRIGTPFPPDLENESRITRVQKIMNYNVFPISHYIHSIGACTIENQRNIPLCDFSRPEVIRLLTAEGYVVESFPARTISLGPDNPVFGTPMWVEFVSDEALAEAVVREVIRNDGLAFTPVALENMNEAMLRLSGLVRLRPPVDVFPTLESLLSRYHSVLAKLEKRVNSAIEKIDFVADGSPAQLVKYVERGNDIEVWSDRFLSDDLLVQGGVLRYDRDEDGPGDRVCQTMYMADSGAIERYARSVVERVHVK